MNGFKVLAVGAFLCCGPSFCQAQQNNLANQPYAKPVLVLDSDAERFQPSNSNITRQSGRQAEITDQSIASPFLGDNLSPSDTIVDGSVSHPGPKDPASLPVVINKPQNAIENIIRNGLIAQTPHAGQVPVAWPSQTPDNPTARTMLNVGCTQGLWANYPAERAAECARMHKLLAGHQYSHRSIGHQSGNAGCSQPSGIGVGHCANRYAPVQATGGASDCASISVQQKQTIEATQFSSTSNGSKPQFQQLLPLLPTLAEPLNVASESSTQDNVALNPSLIR